MRDTGDVRVRRRGNVLGAPCVEAVMRGIRAERDDAPSEAVYRYTAVYLPYDQSTVATRIWSSSLQFGRWEWWDVQGVALNFFSPRPNFVRAFLFCLNSLLSL